MNCIWTVYFLLKDAIKQGEMITESSEALCNSLNTSLSTEFYRHLLVLWTVICIQVVEVTEYTHP